MPEYITTVGSLRIGLAHLFDDAPIQFSLNGVATNVYFLPPGVEGGDRILVVEPNYTCRPSDEPDDGLRPIKR